MINWDSVEPVHRFVSYEFVGMEEWARKEKTKMGKKVNAKYVAHECWYSTYT